MGTRMVSAAESPVHDNYKELVVESAETDTVFLNRFHKPGFRVLATPYSEEREQTRDQVPMAVARRPALALLRWRPRRRVRVRRTGRRPHRRGEAGAADHRGDHRGVPRDDPRASRTGTRDERPLPALDGLRVLELAEGIAGAYAGKLLRDQGADVVKHGRSTRAPALVGGDARHAGRRHGGAVRVPQRRQGRASPTSMPTWCDGPTS